MANTIQNGPYEILLRFNCERGEKFGQLRGCHRVMATYLVDDAGNIAGRVDNGETAADFPPDQLTAYLGSQFASFTAQIEAMQATAQQAASDNEALRAALATATNDLAAAKAAVTAATVNTGDI